MTSLDHPRFIAKYAPHMSRWAVYDRVRASWPLNVAGYGVLPDFATEDGAAEEAERLAAFYAKAEVA